MINGSHMESIGKEIEAIMRKKGLSRYRVSKHLGLAQESLLRSLKEGANPRWETVKKVLDYLGYEVVLIPRKRGGETRRTKPATVKTEMKKGGKPK